MSLGRGDRPAAGPDATRIEYLSHNPWGDSYLTQQKREACDTLMQERMIRAMAKSLSGMKKKWRVALRAQRSG
jgi:hypothetical protein